MPIPTSAAITTVRGAMHGAGRREAGAGGVERGDEQLGDEHAAGEAEDRGGQAEEERFDRDHPAHLPARRTDGAHQRQFAQPLTDRDLEDVVDDERADERGDEREDQQAVCRTRR